MRRRETYRHEMALSIAFACFALTLGTLALCAGLWFAAFADCKYPPKKPLLHPAVCDLVLGRVS